MSPAEQPEILSVTQLTRRVKNLLETEVSYVWVSGEVSNWRVSPAGHAYFTLKDKESQVSAVMFKGQLMRLQFEPEDGLEVIVNGLATIYERRGTYQIKCEQMHPKGLGALQLAFEKLRKRLEAEGLFDEAHKKPLPMLPRTVGVVTSPTGAAIRDILNVIHRRFANVHVLLYPARVQGDEAAEEIVEGIRVLDEWGVDVMIVGRGGGSLEDLWPFNEEIVVRAVYEVGTPVISAVGHEIDVALTDLAADVRAPTPSAAAELVVQERAALTETIRRLRRGLGSAMAQRLEQVRNRLALARSSYVFRRPDEFVRQRRQLLDELGMRLNTAVLEQSRCARHRVETSVRSLALLSPRNQFRRAAERLTEMRVRLARSGRGVIERSQNRLRTLVAQLDTLSPLAVLARGYAVAWKHPGRQVVRDAGELAPGDKLSLRFGKGSATAAVEQVENDPHG